MKVLTRSNSGLTSGPVSKKRRQTDKKAAVYLERVQSQKEYIRSLEKFSLSNNDPGVLATLYRLNKGRRGFVDEIEGLNSDLPPMKNSCRMSLLMPAFSEELNIEESLRGWTEQQVFGTPINPDLFEILILINRPNENAKADKTKERALEFIQKNPEFSIHVVEHCFNFPTEPIEVEVNGIITPVARSIRMGLIFKLAADLAIVRNLARDSPHKGNHLIHPTGADVYARNPRFIQNVLNSFSDQQVDFLKVWFMLPRRVCTHIPLIWALHEYRMTISYEYFGKEHLKRHGIFRTGTYAKAGGFNPGIGVGEDTVLGNQFRKVNAKIIKATSPLVADNPRRSITTILDGKILVQGYNGFGINDREMRDFSLDEFLSMEVPSEALFTEENFAKHASGHFRHYLRKSIKDGGNFEVAFQRASLYAKNALIETGFKESDFEIVKGNTASRCSIEITNMENIMERFSQYQAKNVERWMEK